MARSFSRGARRKTQWSRFGDTTGAGTGFPTYVGVAAGAGAITSRGLVVGGGQGFVDEEVTIVRSIGMIGVRHDGTSGVAARFAVGLYITRVEAIAAGVASLPDPQDDPDAEWLYYATGAVVGIGAAAGDRAQEPLANLVFQFDTRGMRKLNTGESTVWVAKAGTDAVEIVTAGRCLVKLP